MKYPNAKQMLTMIYDSLESYEQIPDGSKRLFEALIDDLHYSEGKTIQKKTLEHLQKYFPHLFEKEVRP
jgi:hypothetical protein